MNLRSYHIQHSKWFYYRTDFKCGFCRTSFYPSLYQPHIYFFCLTFSVTNEYSAFIEINFLSNLIIWSLHFLCLITAFEVKCQWAPKRVYRNPKWSNFLLLLVTFSQISLVFPLKRVSFLINDSKLWFVLFLKFSIPLHFDLFAHGFRYVCSMQIV